MKKVLLSLVMIAAPIASAENKSLTTQLAADQWRIGVSLLQKGSEQTNKVLSPYSIHSALTLVRRGANGETGAEIDRALGSTMSTPSRLEGYRELNQSVIRTEQELSIAIANAVFVSKKTPLAASYLDDARRFFGAEPAAVDFSAPEPARQTINSWISERTNSLIPELLPSGEITPETISVLVNALYFKAPWSDQFSASSTKPERFWVSPSHSVQVPMMSHSEDYGFYDDSSWRGLRMSYRGSEYEMILLLPKKKLTSRELLTKVSAQIFSTVLNASRVVKVNLHVPKFSIRESQPLRKTLEELGIRLAFSDRADFSKMSDVPLRISSAQHEAVVTVDENGTEAAAATAFGFATRAFNAEKPIDLRVDHPFAFAVVHSLSGAPLFVGVVGDPST